MKKEGVGKNEGKKEGRQGVMKKRKKEGDHKISDLSPKTLAKIFSFAFALSLSLNIL